MAMSAEAECPRDENGEEVCTVEVTDPGAGGGGGFGGGGGDLGGPPSCGSRKVLQAAPCTPDTPGGTGPDPAEESEKETQRVEAIKRCQDTYKNGVKTVEVRFNNRVANCTAKNGGGIGPITYGVIDDALGVIGMSCYDRALHDRDTEMSNVNEANVACMQKAMNG